MTALDDPIIDKDRNTVDDPSTEESGLIRKLIYASIIAHIAVFMFDLSGLVDPPKLKLEDIAIETEFISEQDLKEQSTKAIPKAKPDPQLAVDKKTLPQLPKVFNIKQKQKPDAPEGETTTEESVPKKADKPKKVVEEQVKPETQKTEAPKVDALELSKKDALRRLALERLRTDKNIKDKRSPSAPKKAPEVGVKGTDQKNRALQQVLTAGKLSASEKKTYGLRLKRYISPKYNIPFTFKNNRELLEVTMGFILESNGNLKKIRITKGSGNRGFDQHVLKILTAIRSYPRPPVDLVGREFELNFNNRTKS